MNLERILAKQFPHLEHTLSPRDCMLYALGVGVGSRPALREELQFTYEDGLEVFPAMVNVISHPGGWTKEPELGIDWVKILHGEQSFDIHAPLAPGRTYVGDHRITDVIDKGPGKGAMLYLQKTLTDKESGHIVSTVTSTYVLRGDGGCGSTSDKAPAVHAVPERPADDSISLTHIAPGRADLPPLRRLQPDPRVSRDRAKGGLRQADPARTVHDGRGDASAAPRLLQ